MIAAMVLASTMVGVPDTPKIAFISREYYPYPSKKISYPRLRICNWDGSQTRVLSPAGQECRDVAWAGPGRLVYTAGPRNSDRSQFSHWTIDLRTGKSRRIAGPETNLSFPGRISEGGRYELDDLHTVTPAGKVVRYKPAPNPWTDPSVGKDGIQAFTIKSSDPAKPGKFTFDGVDLFTLTGPGKQVSPSKYFSSTYWNAAKNQLYVKETESREAKRLYRVDWAATKFTLLCEYGFSIDWWPERAKYAFSTPRNMVKYGPTKHLYSSELWVGDLRLGITRPIRRGEVEIWAVAVQPL